MTLFAQDKLTAEGDSVVVEINGKPVCRSAMSIDRRFGLLGEQDRACRVRAIRLTGPWPETLPDNLLEPRLRSPGSSTVSAPFSEKLSGRRRADA